VAHYSTGDEQSIVFLCGVEIRATDTAALDGDDDLPRARSGIIYGFNAEWGSGLMKYGCTHCCYLLVCAGGVSVSVAIAAKKGTSTFVAWLSTRIEF
jgi:hypothetical protein